MTDSTIRLPSLRGSGSTAASAYGTFLLGRTGDDEQLVLGYMNGTRLNTAAGPLTRQGVRPWRQEDGGCLGAAR